MLVLQEFRLSWIYFSPFGMQFIFLQVLSSSSRLFDSLSEGLEHCTQAVALFLAASVCFNEVNGAKVGYEMKRLPLEGVVPECMILLCLYICCYIRPNIKWQQ